MTDARLERVADVYRTAVELGEYPVEAVKEDQFVSRSYAGELVRQARKRGFLGPARPGKAGEAPVDTSEIKSHRDPAADRGTDPSTESP